MPVEQHCIGWDRPPAEAMAARLLPDGFAPGAEDFGDTLIVVPTREAGRRLREALARRCADAGAALLGAVTVEPAWLFSHTPPPRLAGPAVVQAAWARTLLDAPPFPALLPHRPERPDWAWALRTGDLLQDVRRRLADGGCRPAEVAARAGPELEEPERWADLAAAEALYLHQLGALGYTDPCLHQLARVREPALPPAIRRLVLAGVPDPSPLAVRILETLAATHRIEILIHAPAERAGDFDAWGRPRPEAWAGAVLPVDDPAGCLHTAEDPADQNRQALAILAAHAGHYAPGDIAIGLPDPALAPGLESELAAAGIPAYAPADRPLRDHPLTRLAAGLADLAVSRRLPDAVALLRHPLLQDRLEAAGGPPPATLLAELDAALAAFLPTSLDALHEALHDPARLRAARCGALDGLRRALDSLLDWLRPLGPATPPADALRAVLRAIAGSLTLDPARAADRDTEAAAACLADTLGELDARTAAALGLDHATQLALLRRRLHEQRYPVDADPEGIAVEGWLELPWSAAPLLLVLSMNEGVVPASRPADPFLPDSLRRRLGLRHEAGLFARDLFLATTLAEARRSQGGLHIIACRADTEGNPLKPSRLLLRCAEEDLAGRVRLLFTPGRPHHPAPPATVSFPLDPLRPPARPTEDLLARLPVTALRDYLDCPFRFHLKRRLGMEPPPVTDRDMQATDFGILLHHALEAMAADPGLWAADNPHRLGAFLTDTARAWVRTRYGRNPPLPVRLALETAATRLQAAAAAQVRHRQDGWDILLCEQKRTLAAGPATLVGKIDRLDRHRETGRLLVIDYKTSDAPIAPPAAHLARARPDDPAYARAGAAGEGRRWIDLQLPLYAAMCAAEAAGGAGLDVAYFNLPKAVSHTGLQGWPDFAPALTTDALACAGAIASRVADGCFGPPAARPRYDECAALFPAGIAAGIPPAAAAALQGAGGEGGSHAAP